MTSVCVAIAVCPSPILSNSGERCEPKLAVKKSYSCPPEASFCAE